MMHINSSTNIHLMANLKIGSASGDIEVKHASPKEIEITSASGNISASDVKCKDFTAAVASGRIKLDNLISSEQINAKTEAERLRERF